MWSRFLTAANPSHSSSLVPASSRQLRLTLLRCLHASRAAQVPVSDSTLRDVLQDEQASRAKTVHSCLVDTPVPEAIRMMKSGQVGSILVTAEDKVKGLLSEKDYIMNLDHGAFCPSDIVASSIMTPKLVSCSVDTPVLDAIEWMLTHKVRHMPVLGQESFPVLHGGAGETAAESEAPPGDDLPAASISAVVSIRTLLQHVLRVLQEEDAARVAALEAGASAGKGDVVDGEEGSTAETPDESLSQPHAAFTKDLEDVLEWQHAAGKKLLLNADVGDDVTVADAANEMAEAGIMSLLVVEGSKPVGILTSRDILWRLVAGEGGAGGDGATATGPDATTTPITDAMSAPVKCGRPSWTLARAAEYMLSKGLRHLAVVGDSRTVLGVVTMSDLLRVMLADDLAQRKQREGAVKVAKTRDFLNVRLLSGRQGGDEGEEPPTTSER